MSSTVEQISSGAMAESERLTALWETPHNIVAWLSTVDHKKLGMRYIEGRCRA